MYFHFDDNEIWWQILQTHIISVLEMYKNQHSEKDNLIWKFDIYL